MGRILLITDDPARSQGLAQDLSDGLSCEVHDLRAAEAPLGSATAIVTDVLDLGSASVERLRRRLAEVRHGVRSSSCSRPTARGPGSWASPRRDAHALRALRHGSPAGDVWVRRAHPRAGAAFSDEPVPACALRTAAAARRLLPPRSFVAGSADHAGGHRQRDPGHRPRDPGNRDPRLGPGGAAVRRCHAPALPARRPGWRRLRGERSAVGEQERPSPDEGGACCSDVGKIPYPGRDPQQAGAASTNAEAGPSWRSIRRRASSMLVDQGLRAADAAAWSGRTTRMLDGSGYPGRLKGDEIPDLVRLVTVCDIHAALIEQRP